MDKKIQFRWFSVIQYEEEGQYLREMHKNGWKFVKITLPGIYYFEKTQPQDVIYQLDYNQEGRKHKDEYIQMFEDCGWEYLTDFVEYSYFRKPVSDMQGGAEEIFCDDNSRLDMIRRIFKGRMIPLMGIFAAVILPQLAIRISNHSYDITAVFFLLLFVVYVILFASTGMKYLRLKKKLK